MNHHARIRIGTGTPQPPLPASQPSLSRAWPVTLAIMLALAWSSLALSAAFAQTADVATDETPDIDTPQQSVVGWLELSEPLRDGPPPFAWVSEADAGPSLAEVLRQLERVASQPQYLGVVIYLDQPELSLTQVNAIGDAMRQVSESDKQVLTFASSYSMLDYLLAANADMIVLQHKGAVELTGLSIEEMYLGRLLENVGVTADLMQVGQFKGADEPWTRRQPSEAWDRNMDSLLDDLYGQMIERIATGRNLTHDEVEGIIGDAWAMSDHDYLRRRVVDRLSDRDLVDITEIAFGGDFVWDDVMGRAERALKNTNPLALLQTLFQERKPTTRRDTIAVLRAVGPITSGESSFGDGAFSADRVGSRTLVKTLGEIRDNPQIRGVVVRIDSPGGSALASELIWQALRDVGEHKPVFASIDGMAASGGYYLAAGAHEVYVSPPSIVGSIGVVGGKVVLGDLYEKIGLNVHRRSRGPLADMFNSVEPFTDEQRAAVRAGLERVYDQFIDRVEIGRGNRLPDATSVAEGRLFTGRQAVDNGMADALGGIDETVAAVAARAGLEEGQYDVLHLPPPMSLNQFLESLFGGSQARMQQAGVTAQHAAVLAMGQQLLGPEAWRAVQQVMTGMTLLRDEPAVTLMPYAIVVR